MIPKYPINLDTISTGATTRLQMEEDETQSVMLRIYPEIVLKWKIMDGFSISKYQLVRAYPGQITLKEITPINKLDDILENETYYIALNGGVWSPKKIMFAEVMTHGYVNIDNLVVRFNKGNSEIDNLRKLFIFLGEKRKELSADFGRRFLKMNIE